MKKIFALFLVAFLLSTPAYAGIALIRDAEIEKTLRDYSTPIFEAAGLNPDSIKIYLVNDKSLNAFVAGGMNLFINTGLITQSDDANMLIGVIAHETGHISGGHIIKRGNELEGLSMQTALSAILGAAVTVAGLPDAGMAIITGGQHVAERGFLQYSRSQEVAADQSGLKYLKQTRQSAKGLLKLMQILRRDHTLNYDVVDPYAISHPLTQERVAHIRSYVEDEKDVVNDKFEMAHKRMVAKLDGFMDKPQLTMQKYSDESIPSIYARSIAYYLQSDADNALAEVDKLLAQEPDDPFFNEFKGQILFENGHIDESIGYYNKALAGYPDSAIFQFELGKIHLAANNLDEAIDYLNKAAASDTKNDQTWRLLATAYGKKNNTGMLNLTLAEEANILGKKDEALNYAKIAKQALEDNSAGWVRANDLISEIKYGKAKE
ncbi:MAG: peptidase [Alphaproteobacteria bacterium CG11_big_fil_rev_8_21_14_0_20_44_7]|nr:MAG: peptidase [Alphaproteobacteria bacterium CG11_big_fil_rev_8_21_14_0_20_44_7]